MSLPAWRGRAKCVGMDPALFDADTAQVAPMPGERKNYAQKVCEGCPVIKECATDALDYGDTGVIRGGIWLAAPTSAQASNRQKLLNIANTMEGVPA